ncbi:MAG: hypothetical protein GY906_24045 [bacterium]|nr:hypothetical protein [bacterium]
MKIDNPEIAAMVAELQGQIMDLSGRAAQQALNAAHWRNQYETLKRQTDEPDDPNSPE